VPQVTKALDMPGWTDIPPERQGVDFGQADYFKYILNDSEVVRSMTLCVLLDGLAPGAGGSNPRYPDDPLAAAIDRVEFQYGKTIQQIDGDRIHFDFLAEAIQSEFNHNSVLRGCNVGPGERIVAAATPSWYYLRLPLFFSERDSDAWHQYALQRLTRLIIHWRTPDAILQQEGANTRPTPISGGAYILDHFIRCEIVAPIQATKEEYIRRVTSQGTAGWLYLIGETERLTQQLNQGTSQTVVQLNTFTKYGQNLRFVVRKVSSLTPNYLDNDRWALMPINTVRLDMAGKTFFPTVDNYYLTYAIDDKLFPGNSEWEIYNIPFTAHPAMPTAAVGGIDFSNAANPQLTVTYDTLPTNAVVDFWLHVQNYVRITIMGNQSGAELVQPL
jgi:hypothetical protein